MKNILSICAIIILGVSCQKSDILQPINTESSRLLNNATSTAVTRTNLILGPVTDVDGNIYHTVTIGTQTWMVENLKTTKFRDGTPIPNVTDVTTWRNLTTAAYVNPHNDAQYVPEYGRLYNWYAVGDTKRLLAPVGWHIPSDDEWATLVSSLGGMSVAGGKLKEAGFTHWQSPNPTSGGVGFNALPGGMWYPVDDGFGRYCHFWSSTRSTTATAGNCNFLYTNSAANLNDYHSLKEGLSVRCIQDVTKGSF